jgi:hypothetical protein
MGGVQERFIERRHPFRERAFGNPTGATGFIVGLRAELSRQLETKDAATAASDETLQSPHTPTDDR